MIDYTTYASFVQLAVAFNFAFVCIKKLSSSTLFQHLFADVKNSIRESYDKVYNNCNILLTKSIENNEGNAINKKLRRKLKKDTNLLIIKIDWLIKKVDNRIELNPLFFNQACLILGLYSILLLFILGDYKNHSLTNNAWPLFTIGIIGYLFTLLIKEILVFFKLKTIECFPKSLKTTIITICIFVCSYLAILLWELVLSHYIICKFTFSTSFIRYISIFLPYVSFAICFILYLLSIIYAKWRIYWINVLIHRQESTINEVLRNNKVSGIQFS